MTSRKWPLALPAASSSIVATNALGGMCGLRQARERYPSEEALIAFLREPSAFVPGTKMPSYKNVIADDEWAPLAAFVRQLEAAPTAP